jgi:hypothetical protein
MNWQKSSFSAGACACVEVRGNWQKSTFSDGSGCCVEVRNNWHKSSACISGYCVEVSEHPVEVLVRNTRMRTEELTLSVGADKWQAFVDAMKGLP